MKKLRLTMLATVIIVLLVTGVVILQGNGIKANKQIKAKATYTIGEALNKKFDIKNKNIVIRSAKKATWNINGREIGNGKSIQIKDINYLEEGENILTANYGKDKVTYKILISKMHEGEEQAQKTARLLDPIASAIIKEGTTFLDTDGDGVSDQDEIDKYKTDPKNDYSNYKGISDLAYATIKEGLTEGNQKLDIVNQNAMITPISKNIEDILKITLSPALDKRLSNKIAVNVSGIKPNAPATLTLKDTKISEYKQPSLAMLKANGDISLVKEAKLNKEKAELSAKINSNGTYFILDNVAFDPNDLEKLNHTEIAIVLDNSGSMYSKEEWIKRGYDQSELNDDLGQDVDFKRVSLMTAMIDSLAKEENKGRGSYKYSVSSFTSDYLLISNITTASNAKKAVESIKDTKQEFNGTKIEKSISFAKDKFTEGLLGNKVVICLTDGETTSGGLFDFDIDQSIAESNLADTLRNQNIDLILIGLGNKVNKSKLQQLANQSGGIVLYANDADALEKLLGRVVNKVKVGSIEGVVYNKSEEDKNSSIATIIADSGFDAKVDGFNFGNFGSNTSEGGNCFGFSITAKMVYEGFNENDQFWKLGKTKIHDKPSEAIGKLANFVSDIPEAGLTKRALSMLKKGQVYNAKVDIPNLFTLKDKTLPRNFKDGYWYYTKESKKEILDNGYDIIVQEDYNKEVEGKYVKDYEYRMYNPFSSNAGKKDPDGNSIIKLIARNQLEQIESLVGTISTRSKVDVDFEETFPAIVKSLNAGKPSMISMNCSVGGHSVLATKVSLDTKDPNKYYIYIYDSNEPGKNMIGELALKNIIKNGKLSSKYYFKYYGGGLTFNSLGYRKTVKIYEGVTSTTNYSPTGYTNDGEGVLFYESHQ